MELNCYPQVVSGEYDFNKDPNAGAVGNIDLLTAIPSAAMIKNFWVNPLVALGSGGAATVSFDLNIFTNIGTFIVGAILFPVVPFGALGVVGVPILGFTNILNPFKVGVFTSTVSGVNVSMTIAGAPLNAGRLQYWVEYIENDI